MLMAAMQEEAVEARRRMTEDQEALLPELRGNSGVEPPYSHAHVSETAIHREILRIYNRARPETRQVYDLGRDTERVEEENWVIRWMLWHVFRYRDNRNKTRRPTSGSMSSSIASGSISPRAVRAPPPTGGGRTGSSMDVRLGSNMNLSGYAVVTASDSRHSVPLTKVHYATRQLCPETTAPRSGTSRYWDPVRNG